MKEGVEGKTPKEIMDLNIQELRSGEDHEKKGLIAKKLKKYLEKEYPNCHQQIHAHVMSINASELIGVLFTPGIFDEDLQNIINGREEYGKTKVSKEKDKLREKEWEVNGGEMNVTD